MASSYKIWFTAGAILVLVGSFLPWVQAGDLFSFYTPGIRIYQVDGAQTYPTIEDNGGVLVVLLTLVVIWLAYRPPGFILGLRKAKFICSAALVLLSCFHILIINLEHARLPVIGAPVVDWGLVMVFTGSIILLSMTLMFSSRDGGML